MMAPYTPRERKHRKRARAEEGGDGDGQRRQDLRDDLLAPDVKINPKKRKRLDKYIETKLRKEENANIISKLAGQTAIDTSLLQSSKRLGRVSENKRERLQRALRERDAGIGNGEELYESRRQVEEDSGDLSEAESDDSVEAHEPAVAEIAAAKKTQTETMGFGGGLKQPMQLDEQGKPLIRRRKRRKKSLPTQQPVVESGSDDGGSSDVGEKQDADDATDSSQESEDEWQGFSDSDAGLASNESATSELEGSEAETDEDSDTKPRISAFKQWADMQRNAASDFTPSTAPTVDATIKANFKPRAPSPDPLLASTTSATSARPAGAITIERSDSMQSARMELPVVQEEQKIMEAIHNNPIVVICGATGSGKTTQVPQMLYENGYGSQVGSRGVYASTSGILQNRGMIGVTQPRRVAATSVADRVSYELDSSDRNRVAHQVRYDSNVGRDTAIKFMTDGILLREIQQDFALTKYSCIVIDEAHERSVNTDILIGLLSRIVPLRHSMAKEEPDKHYPLKLVIMSATLRVADFLKNDRLFTDGPPPIVEAEGRQYPVTVHFARRTRQDFIDEMVEKVAKGHRKLPAGSMLVFLTGQQEIQTVATRLKERLGGARGRDDFDRHNPQSNRGGYIEDDLEAERADDSDDAEIDVDDDNEFAIPTTDEPTARQSKAPPKPQILPLYAALPASQQSKVFDPSPEGRRQIILATNVAETSLTIPGIRYVFDCGRSKEKVYSPTSGIQSFATQWISKASASQRTGRAGRTGPGHCWRLYSSAVFEQFFAEHADPEILRTPLESVVLQLKGFNVENVPNFPFPTPPERLQLVAAEKLLVNLGAIRQGSITRIGEELAQLPVSPRFGKMLLKGRQTGMLEYVVALVAGLTVGELFVPEPQTVAPRHDSDEDEYDDRSHQQRKDDEESRQGHQAYTRAQAKMAMADERSDAVKILTAVVMHSEAASKKGDKGEAFSRQYFLRQKGMEEAQQLRQQLWHLLATAQAGKGVVLGQFTAVLPPPNEAKLGFIRQAAAVGFVEQVAIRADLLPNGAGAVPLGRKPRRSAEVAYRPLVPLSHANEGVDEKGLEPSEKELLRSVFVHPSSVLARLSVAEMPGYVVYSHLSRVGGTSAKVPRTRMHPLTAIGPRTLAYVAEKTPLIQYGKPATTGGGGGLADRKGVVELEGGRKRECWVTVSVRAPGAGAETEWPLDFWKVVQRRGTRGEWSVERVMEYGVVKKG